MESKTRSMNLVVGSMLFGLFFGAGNLIFPVHMGQEAGGSVIPATIGFLLTATGIPFLGILAMGLTGSKNIVQLGSRVNKVYAYVVTVLLYLTIGPLFALPRTATVSFEVGLAPVLSPEQTRPALFIFTLLFFIIALVFSLKPSRILDWVGKILNPIFLIFLAYMFIRAFMSPMGIANAAIVSESYQTSPMIKGFLEGYQTMDALAALAFGSIVIASIESFGITAPKQVAQSTLKSGLITLVLMCLIYSGLAWLGATSTSVFPVSANGGIAWAEISSHYLGTYGSIFLALMITVACLKTAIGLITSCAGTFYELFGKKLSYKIYAVLFAGFSFIMANVGLTQLIALAIPMLMFLYPLAITLIFLSIFEKFFGGSKIVYNATTIGALFVSIGDGLANMPDVISTTPIVTAIVGFYKAYVPFFSIGMGWVIPAGIGLVVGLIIYFIKGRDFA